MFRTVSKLFFAGVLSLVCLGGATFAQVGQPGAPMQSFQLFTTESVSKMLDGAGLKYQILPGPNSGWKVTNPLNANAPAIELSIMKTPQGLVTGLKMLSRVKTPPSGGYSQPDLMKLLQKNATSYPYYFCVDPMGGDLCMLYTFPNFNSNAQELKLFITLFAVQINQNALIWNNSNQSPYPAAITVEKLPGTTWSGSENLQGFGKLTFQFQANGQVVMTNAKNTVNGTYSVAGNQITIQLPEVAAYKGTINGSMFSGQGKTGQVTWSFSVSVTN